MNAIILAAGMGKRLLPITSNCPKPLVVVNSQPIIERQILFLKEAGINEIHIVVGYLWHAYLYLVKKFNVNLIYNSKYYDINNIYSLYLAKEFLSDSLIIEGDLFLMKNVFKTEFNESFYFTGKRYDFSAEWIFNFNAENKIIEIIKPKELKSVDIYKKKGAYILVGISYWSKKDSSIISYHLEKEIASIVKYPDSASRTFYWDEIVKLNLDKLPVYVRKLNRNDWIEIDSEKDLHYLNGLLASTY